MKMLPRTIFLLLTTKVFSHNLLSESCGCIVESVESVNDRRIPSKIIERYCYEPGTHCLAENYKVSISYFIFSVLINYLPFLQCVQSTGVLEVGYIEKIECDHETKDVVTFRRNLTIGIGCVCKPFGFQKLHLKNNPPY